jgi:hypothetical protein
MADRTDVAKNPMDIGRLPPLVIGDGPRSRFAGRVERVELRLAALSPEEIAAEAADAGSPVPFP